VVGDGKARFGGRGMGAVRRREEGPEWGRSPPLQAGAMDKGAWGGARGRRPRQSLGHRCVAEQLVRAREASDRVPCKRPPSLTGGPRVFIYLSRFSNTYTLIFELVTFLMSKIHKIYLPKDCKL
jgi:hypothetical protein